MKANPGTNALSILVARNTDQLRITHCRVGEEELIQLLRVDILAATNDHVLAAIDDTRIFVGARETPEGRKRNANIIRYPSDRLGSQSAAHLCLLLTYILVSNEVRPTIRVEVKA